MAPRLNASAQLLDRTLICYRIGDPDGEFPIFDSKGSALFPGRWNTSDSPVIYAAEHYSAAMLEKLAVGNGHLPPNQHFIQIIIPGGTPYEIVTKDILPNWDSVEPSISQQFGAKWVRENRSAILLVPSYVSRVERNVIINPKHEASSRIECGLSEPVWWDERLFHSQPTSK